MPQVLFQLYQTRQICLAVLHGTDVLPIYVKFATAEYRILLNSLKPTPFPPQTWNITLINSQCTPQQHSLHYVRLISSALEILFLFSLFFLSLITFTHCGKRRSSFTHFLLPKLLSATSTSPLLHPRSYNSTQLTVISAVSTAWAERPALVSLCEHTGLQRLIWIRLLLEHEHQEQHLCAVQQPHLTVPRREHSKQLPKSSNKRANQEY